MTSTPGAEPTLSFLALAPNGGGATIHANIVEVAP